MSSDVTMTALHSALSGLAERQRVISDNVSNIQTPGFLAGKVDFESALKDALASGQSPDTGYSTARSLEPTREDGNNVNLDEESLLDIQTGLRYQLVLRAVDDQFSRMRTALKAGM